MIVLVRPVKPFLSSVHHWFLSAGLCVCVCVCVCECEWVNDDIP